MIINRFEGSIACVAIVGAIILGPAERLMNRVQHPLVAAASRVVATQQMAKMDLPAIPLPPAAPDVASIPEVPTHCKGLSASEGVRMRGELARAQAEIVRAKVRAKAEILRQRLVHDAHVQTVTFRFDG